MNNDLKELADQILDALSRISDEQAFVKDLYKQASWKGYDTKVLKRAIALISRDRVKQAAEEIQLLDVYLSNLNQPTLF